MSNRDDNKFNFVIVTGMSGAGKSQACRFMEDLDYFVVDNLPPVFIPKFAELCQHSEAHDFTLVAKWLGEAVRTASNLQHNSGQQSSTLRTELFISSAMIFIAVETEGTAHLLLFLWQIFLWISWLPLWKHIFYLIENTHN